MADKRIVVNRHGIDDAISNLNSLCMKCDTFYKETPQTVGGGRTIEEIENMAQMYRDINRTLRSLFKNTSIFLGDVRDSFSSADQQASTGINK